MPLSIAIKKYGTITADPGNILAATSLELTLTISGARVGDMVIINAPSLEANLNLGPAWVSATNTVKVRITNPTVGAIDPASQSFNYWLI